MTQAILDAIHRLDGLLKEAGLSGLASVSLYSADEARGLMDMVRRDMRAQYITPDYGQRGRLPGHAIGLVGTVLVDFDMRRRPPSGVAGDWR